MSSSAIPSLFHSSSEATSNTPRKAITAESALFKNIPHRTETRLSSSRFPHKQYFPPSFSEFPIALKTFSSSASHSQSIYRNSFKSKSLTEAVPMTLGFPALDSLRAVLFDVDGTLADSDPLHFLAFQEILQEVGFQGGAPIDEEFFRAHISGRHNPDIGADLFPHWSIERRNAFLEDKEKRFRKLAAEKLHEVQGLKRFCKWVEHRGLRRAAVTNAPRENAEQMIRSLGLSDFFEILIIGSECQRAKPFPDPYLTALKYFSVAPHHAFAVEDSPAGLKSAITAGLPTVGVLTGQESTVLEKAGASIIIKNFDDPLLWQIIDPRT